MFKVGLLTQFIAKTEINTNYAFKSYRYCSLLM